MDCSLAEAGILRWADRLDGWARDLGDARAALGLDHSPDPYLLRQLAKAMRAEHLNPAGNGAHQPATTDFHKPEAGVKTGPRGKQDRGLETHNAGLVP